MIPSPIVGLALALSLAAAPAHRAKFLVLDIKDVSGQDAAAAKLLTEVVFSDVSSLGRYEMMNEQAVRDLLGMARQRELLGCNEDSSCLAEIGGALGADFILSGQLGRLGSRYRLDLQLVDARKSRVLASAGAFTETSGDALAKAISTLARQVLDQAGLGAPERDAASAAPAMPEQAVAGPQPGHSRTPGWVVLAVGGALAAGATAMTVVTYSEYKGLHPGSPLADADSEFLHAHIADGLWAGALVAGGVATYLLISARPSAGGGGEVVISGRF